MERKSFSIFLFIQSVNEKDSWHNLRCTNHLFKKRLLKRAKLSFASFKEKMVPAEFWRQESVRASLQLRLKERAINGQPKAVALATVARTSLESTSAIITSSSISSPIPLNNLGDEEEVMADDRDSRDRSRLNGRLRCSAHLEDETDRPTGTFLALKEELHCSAWKSSFFH